MRQIGIIGCGAIGSTVARFVDDTLVRAISSVSLCDSDSQKSNALLTSLKRAGTAYRCYEELIDAVDFVVEASSAKISAAVAERALAQGKDVMVMSIGGLLDAMHVWTLAEQHGGTLHLPSGAIAGLDALCAARLVGVTSAQIITRKPPVGLEGAPYLVQKGISLNNLRGVQVLFEGSAREAVAYFPQNVNVAALLSLATLGPDRTRVRIETSDAFMTNSHEIEVKGSFGTLTVRTDNVPDPRNPKTSYLASLSACAMLQKHFSAVKIGV